MTRKEFLGVSILGIVSALVISYIGFNVMKFHERIDDLQMRREAGYERNKERFDRLREEVQELKREVERLNDEKRAAVQPPSEDETTFALSRQAEEVAGSLPDSVPCCGEPNLTCRN